MICALGISHNDAQRAARWLEWVAELEAHEARSQPALHVFFTQIGRDTSINRVKAAGKDIVTGWHVIPDECETGYPKAASHLFLRSLEICEKDFPGEPILWLESDAIPMGPNWRFSIAAEYSNEGKPFLGVIERAHGFVHMPGVAVYPPNWRELAPLLANVLSAPDIPLWGQGKGQAWDTYAASQTIPQCAEATTIQQIWVPPHPFTRQWVTKNIRQGTALFHQCKDGSLIRLLRESLA